MPGDVGQHHQELLDGLLQVESRRYYLCAPTAGQHHHVDARSQPLLGDIDHHTVFHSVVCTSIPREPTLDETSGPVASPGRTDLVSEGGHDIAFRDAPGERRPEEISAMDRGYARPQMNQIDREGVR